MTSREPESVPSAADFVPIAEVVKPVGLKGDVKLYALLDWHEPLLASAYLVWDDGTTARVVRRRDHASGAIVGLAGCEDREAARSLCGRRLGFNRADYLDEGFPRPPAGLPFRYLGREVRLVTGGLVGQVDEVRRYAAQITLVVLREGREVLIPAIAPILKVDVGLEGPLLIDPPEGLLDVGD